MLYKSIACREEKDRFLGVKLFGAEFLENGSNMANFTGLSTLDIEHRAGQVQADATPQKQTTTPMGRLE